MTVRSRAVDLVLPIGLTVSAVLVGVIAGWPGLIVAGMQLIAAIGLMIRPAQAGVLAVAAVILFLTPVAALRTWLAKSPLGCSCFGAPAHPPGLVSLTGLVVLTNLGLVGLAAWSARSSMTPGATAAPGPDSERTIE